jgi:general secretion pathway protein F/type IV pilus assembly protein PilC
LLLTPRTFLYSYGLSAAGAIVALVLLGRRFIRTDRGRELADRWKLRLPVAGSIFHDAAVSRFCRVLGTLLRNGVPLLTSLRISSESAGNRLLQQAILDSAENITSGESLSKPLASSGLIPPPTMAMINVAEQSNTLDEVLVRIADRADQRIERRLDVMVRLVEPVMLLTIGGMVLFIIVGVLLPVFDLNATID